MPTSSNKTIAKNTVFLYLRMILILGISLYTSRVVLRILGVTDYGIYNVVAGVVTMLGVLSGSLSGATSRFITYETGKGADGDVERIFRSAATIHYILAALVIVVGETLGLWFVMNKLVIPPDRLMSAFWVYQCSIVAVSIRIISTPYNAIIIANEKMSAFAYISLFEVSLQLGLIFCLELIPGDRLIFYGIFLAMTQILTRVIYNVYCVRHFKEVNGRWLWDKKSSKEILKFASWTLVGFGAVMGYTQGINILLNLFFGPVANAARGFANQVQAGVSQLSTNFQMALRPPIIKAHAQNEYSHMHSLMIAHAKYSFFLVLMMVVPIMISTPYILKLWLATVPEYTVGFVRLTLIGALYTTLNGHVIVGIHATGNIKRFQIVEGALLLTTLPIAYLCLKFGHMSAYGVIIVYLIVEFFTQFARVWIVYPLVKLRKKYYFTKICLPLIAVLIPIIPYTLYGMEHLSANSFGALMGNIAISVAVCMVAISILGLTHSERQKIGSQVKRMLNKVAHRN